MSISFFWLERGGGWGLSPSTSPTNHQKLNIIQKWALYCFGWRGLADEPGWSSEVECNPKTSILFFSLERGGGWVTSPTTSPADHQKLNIIQKWAFWFFWLERGGGEGLNPSTSQADHQKLNVIQKQAFNSFSCRGVVDGVRVHWPAQPIIRSWM